MRTVNSEFIEFEKLSQEIENNCGYMYQGSDDLTLQPQERIEIAEQTF